MTMTGLEADVREAYRNFGEREARGNSSLYEQACRLIAADDRLLGSIAGLPAGKRQPNLVLGAARHLGAPQDDASALVGWIGEHWDAVAEVALQRATQTNEVGRCATLLPFLDAAAHGRPIALVEVGCSAGLALYPDLYRYRYERGGDGEGMDASPTHLVPDDGEGGDAPVLRCTVTDARTWQRVSELDGSPRIAWRGGLDLNPLDVTGPDAQARENARWLSALVWPGQEERRERLDAAIAVVRERTRVEGAPTVVRGDVVADLPRLLAQVPDDLPLVLFHSAVLAYTDAATRQAFEAAMSELATRPSGFTWISNEAPSVLPGVATRLEVLGHPRDAPSRFVLAVDGEPAAWTGPHGQSLDLI